MGVVTRVEYFGHDSRVELNLRDQDPTVRVVVRIAGEAPPPAGAVVRVTVAGSVWAVT